FLFLNLNPARGVRCITVGVAKRNLRIDKPIFLSPAWGEIMVVRADNLAPCGALFGVIRFP
ncbi:MAG: hypothetical protein LBP87_16050, partial [Planctomycetaceae bacterium]|nr:hypothetical protein [Planctomycetaceae bacterium]